MVTFEPIQQGRASGILVKQIRDAILNGRLPVGERLPAERDLAEQVGVSRVTVRDAFRVLEANGLVKIRPGAKGGAFVAAPEPSIVGDGLANLMALTDLDSREITEARLVIEVAAVKLACERATADDVAELYAICTRSDEAAAEDAYDIAFSAEFHTALARASGNRVLGIVVESLAASLLLSLAEAREHSADYGVGSDRHDHRAIVDCIAAGDDLRAATLMREHLERTLLRLESSP